MASPSQQAESAHSSTATIFHEAVCYPWTIIQASVSPYVGPSVPTMGPSRPTSALGPKVGPKMEPTP